MPNTYFSFKKFTIHHDKCAMKVGTDGVLLGAWADVSESKNILDIGTGTGLISIMLAQRSHAYITGIDIDSGAVEQAKENASASPWSDRIEICLADVNQYTPSLTFDTIVSNPPFFIDSLKCPDQQRNTARHTDTLTMADLFGKAYCLLSANGHFSLIIPFDQTPQIIQTAERVGLYPSRHTKVHTRPGIPPKRSLLEFSKVQSICNEEDITIELERHVYSEEYIALTKEFYLKM